MSMSLLAAGPPHSNPDNQGPRMNPAHSEAVPNHSEYDRLADFIQVSETPESRSPIPHSALPPVWLYIKSLKNPCVGTIEGNR